MNMKFALLLLLIVHVHAAPILLGYLAAKSVKKAAQVVEVAEDTTKLASKAKSKTP
jgi:uncharacterized protein (UPF0333 family)